MLQPATAGTVMLSAVPIILGFPIITRSKLSTLPSGLRFAWQSIRSHKFPRKNREVVGSRRQS